MDYHPAPARPCGIGSRRRALVRVSRLPSSLCKALLWRGATSITAWVHHDATFIPRQILFFNV